VRAFVRWGASPRAAQSLIAAARANALASGRVHVAFEDLRRFAIDTLQHRVILNYDGQAEGKTTAFIVEGLLASLPEDAK
jgi:MoxR-like ATPase